MKTSRDFLRALPGIFLVATGVLIAFGAPPDRIGLALVFAGIASTIANARD